MSIDLSPFLCADADRQDLQKPFTYGEWTCATDGKILVRVPRIAMCAKCTPSLRKQVEKIIASAIDAPTERLPQFAFPSDLQTKCISCNGSRTKHDCPGCACECAMCEGTGFIGKKISATIGGELFAAEYIKLLMTLPNVRVPAKATHGIPMAFSFDGGVGVLMGLTSRYATHVEAISP